MGRHRCATATAGTRNPYDGGDACLPTASATTGLGQWTPHYRDATGSPRACSLSLWNPRSWSTCEQATSRMPRCDCHYLQWAGYTIQTRWYGYIKTSLSQWMLRRTQWSTALYTLYSIENANKIQVHIASICGSSSRRWLPQLHGAMPSTWRLQFLCCFGRSGIRQWVGRPHESTSPILLDTNGGTGWRLCNFGRTMWPNFATTWLALAPDQSGQGNPSWKKFGVSKHWDWETSVRWMWRISYCYSWCCYWWYNGWLEASLFSNTQNYRSPRMTDSHQAYGWHLSSSSSEAWRGYIACTFTRGIGGRSPPNPQHWWSLQEVFALSSSMMPSTAPVHVQRCHKRCQWVVYRMGRAMQRRNWNGTHRRYALGCVPSAIAFFLTSIMYRQRTTTTTRYFNGLPLPIMHPRKILTVRIMFLGPKNIEWTTWKN